MRRKTIGRRKLGAKALTPVCNPLRLAVAAYKLPPLPGRESLRLVKLAGWWVGATRDGAARVAVCARRGRKLGGMVAKVAGRLIGQGRRAMPAGRVGAPRRVLAWVGGAR